MQSFWTIEFNSKVSTVTFSIEVIQRIPQYSWLSSYQLFLGFGIHGIFLFLLFCFVENEPPVFWHAERWFSHLVLNHPLWPPKCPIQIRNDSKCECKFIYPGKWIVLIKRKKKLPASYMLICTVIPEKHWLHDYFSMELFLKK